MVTLNGLFANQVSLNNLTAIGVLIMAAVALFFERHLPFRKDWNVSKNDVISDFILTMLIFPMVINLCRWLVNLYPTDLKIIDLSQYHIAIQVAVGVLLSEFLFYWIHRLSHENKILWTLHRWHHSIKRVYWLNSGTLNPLDMVLNFVGYCLPFALISMSPAALEYALFFTAITGLLEHTNVDFKAGALNYVFNTAELHRWHHSVIVKESQKNYGKALSIWDLAFSTFYLPKHKQVEKVGLE